MASPTPREVPNGSPLQPPGPDSSSTPTFQTIASLARSGGLVPKRATVSTMSLPLFRLQNPRLFWPVDTHDAMVEITPAENLENPHEFGIEYLNGVVGFSGNKTMVIKGKVWKENRQPELLAVKIILYNDKQTRSKAIEEFRILQSIKHHHIIAAIGSCSTELNGEIRLGILLYPLAKMNLEQYLKNISEDRVVDSKAKSARELLSFYACLCQTVLHLHARGSPIKHRDIKPTNILIDSEGTVILADFDIAKQYDNKSMAVTIRGMEYTIKYAPKHVVNQTWAGLEWDINCLGFVFLEMATVILGKTIEELPPFLHQKHGTEVTKRESVARTTGTTETAEMTEIRFSDALEEGTIGKWLEELSYHASANRPLMPSQLRTSTAVDKFLAMIDRMMRTTDRDGSVLYEACELFSTLNEPCKYCRASLVPIGPATHMPSRDTQADNSTITTQADASDHSAILNTGDIAQCTGQSLQPPSRPHVNGTSKGKTPAIAGGSPSTSFPLRSKGRK